MLSPSQSSAILSLCGCAGPLVAISWRADMGIEGDSMLSPTLIKCNFVKLEKGLRFHPIRTNCPASARDITSKRWTSAAGRSWGGKPLSRGALYLEPATPE